MAAAGACARADHPGKRAIAGPPLDQPGDLGTVLRVYLVFNEGYGGNDEPEVSWLLAFMLLHRARRASRTGPGGLVPLMEEDRSRWDAGLIAEGVAILQAALACDRLGEYQAQTAIAALHADARTTAEAEADRGEVRRTAAPAPD